MKITIKFFKNDENFDVCFTGYNTIFFLLLLEFDELKKEVFNNHLS